MKRIGIVGVGEWSSQLREAFMREGCHVVAHARKSEVLYPCSGPLVSIEEMVRMEDVDFVVAAADPETTTRAVELCAEWCKPVVATKPLLRHPKLCSAPITVDFWRLTSIPWLTFRRAVREAEEEEDSAGWIAIGTSGEGPKRSFSGLLDYGPHALAHLADAGYQIENLSVFSFDNTPTGELCIGTSIDGLQAVTFGNGDSERKWWMRYAFPAGGQMTFEDEEGLLTFTNREGEKLRQEKGSALRLFAKRCLDARIETNFTYDLSRRASGVLDRILAEQARRSDEPSRQPLQDAPGDRVPDQG